MIDIEDLLEFMDTWDFFVLCPRCRAIIGGEYLNAREDEKGNDVLINYLLENEFDPHIYDMDYVDIKLHHQDTNVKYLNNKILPFG